MEKPDVAQSAMPDAFDFMLGQLEGLPDVVKIRQPAVRRVVPPLGVGGTTLYTVQTIRHGDKYMIALEVVRGGETPFRHVLPDEVCALFASQRESLSTQLRRKIGKRNAEERKARGEKPGFMLSKAERAARKAVKGKKG